MFIFKAHVPKQKLGMQNLLRINPYKLSECAKIKKKIHLQNLIL